MLRLALYANWYESLGRVVIEQILFSTGDSRTLRGTGLHAIGRIFGQVVIDYFFCGGIILVVRQESGSAPVLLDSWNKYTNTDSQATSGKRISFSQFFSPELRHVV